MAASGPSTARFMVGIWEKDATCDPSPGPRVLVRRSPPVGKQPDQVHSRPPLPGACWTAAALAPRFELCRSALPPGLLPPPSEACSTPRFPVTKWALETFSNLPRLPISCLRHAS